ncbi:MAG: cobalamin-binding protein [Nitrospiraceae bacterium]|nr:cobalamin-binding protein [Nitrospiraceae bacterium]
MRICSLLPGATEVVAALGLAHHLVGVSHECDYPPEVRNKPVMVRPIIDSERASSRRIDEQVKAAVHNGRSLYGLDETLFEHARPDLVITQDLCHVCAVTPDQLQRVLHTLPTAPNVLTLNPTCLDHVLSDVERIGAAVGRTADAQRLVSSLRSRLAAIRAQVALASTRPTVACLEWLDPLYAAGHWVPEMVQWAGGSDALGMAGAPSEPVTWERLAASEPDVIILMPCGFSAERAAGEAETLMSNQDWSRLQALRNGRMYAVDAVSYFSRPGPRLIEGVAQLAALCHPSLFGHVVPPGVRRVAEC